MHSRTTERLARDTLRKPGVVVMCPCLRDWLPQRLRATPVVPALTLLVLLLALGGVPDCLADVKKTASGYEFAYEDPGASKVSLAGLFNNWNMEATPMTQDDKGVWRVTIQLPPGKHEYKFVVNGANWVTDPDNPVVAGDYGNSQIEIGSDGELVWRAEATKFSNTPLSSRVAVNGFFRATYWSRSDVDGDARFRLTRPEHEFNLDVNVKVSENVLGSGRLQMDTSLGDVQETQGRLYSGHLDLLSAPFDLRAYYNEEVLAYDDPLELVGHENLAGTIREEHIQFGRGTQGAIAKFRGFDTSGFAFFSNTYDQDRFNDPAIYDNTDTDVMGARLTRAILDEEVRLGLSWVRRQNGWWVDFVSGSNTRAVIDSFKAATGSLSDWFEIGTVDQTFAVDATVELPTGLLLSAEFATWSWDGRWDVGNRERLEGTNYVNGEVDIPVGDDSGNLFKAVLAGSGPLELSWEVAHESRRYDGMDQGELYVDFCRSHFADPAVGQFVGINAAPDFSIQEFPALPERKDDITELELAFAYGSLKGMLELDRTKTERQYSFATGVSPDGPSDQANESWRFAPGASISLVGGLLTLGVDYEQVDNDPQGQFFFSAPLNDPCFAQYYDTRELILSGRLRLSDRFAGLWDVRRMVYEANEGQQPPGREAYVSPYFALVYSPSRSVELRLGYHVNPVYYNDTPVEGRGNGRQVWRDTYMWEHGAGLFDAERALADVKVVSLMGVITF